MWLPYYKNKVPMTDLTRITLNNSVMPLPRIRVTPTNPPPSSHFATGALINLVDGTLPEEGLSVPPRPGEEGVSSEAWTLYDHAEAEEYRAKGEGWLKQTEKELASMYKLDMELCSDTIAQIRSVVARVRDRHMQAEQACIRSRKLKGKTNLHVEKLAELQCIATDANDLHHITECTRHLTSVIDNIDRQTEDGNRERERTKEQMYVLQDRMGDLDCLTQTPACSICLTNPINRVAIPCGHSYCSGCAGKMTEWGNEWGSTNKCYICRRAVQTVNELHIC